jgi:hypothetical protein
MRSLRWHGFVGIAVMLGAEAGLVAGQPLIGHWFTPLVWTGYVLFVDALAARVTGGSYLTTHRADGLLLAVASIACWWLFEWYNAPRFWRGGADAVGLWWQYHEMEPNLWLRRVGYDWAFATIFPALFLTAAVLRGSLVGGVRPTRWRFSPTPPRWLSVLGAVMVVVPLVIVSEWLVPLVWMGWALLLEPLNARAGRPSWLADLARGDASRLLALLIAGAICGVLWEFWNYWATTRWTYTVPYLGHLKVFEMPALGYLGFPPFALECYAMYHWLRGRLGQSPAAPVI